MNDPGSAPEGYPPIVLEHFRHPQGAGRLPEGARVVQVRVGERRVGAELALDLDIGEGRVRDAAFRAFGCPYLIAAASDLVVQVRARGLKALENWSWRDQAERLSVPTERYGRLLLVEDAVRAGLQRLSGQLAGPAQRSDAGP